MKLREPKGDATNSNHINPLLSMAEGSVKRAAWRMRNWNKSTTSATVSLGVFHLLCAACVNMPHVGDEILDADHPLHAQLTRQGASCNHLGFDVEWYASVTHEGFGYWQDRGIMWQHPQQGTVIAKVVQVLVHAQCNHYLIVNVFKHFSDGQYCKRTSTGLQYVPRAHLNLELVLVPLLNQGNLIPIHLVPDAEKLILVPIV